MKLYVKSTQYQDIDLLSDEELIADVEHELYYGTKPITDFTKDELKALASLEIYSWDAYQNPKAYIEQVYTWAERFSLESATPENFFRNSIGYWTLKSSAPKREPDYISHYFVKGGNYKKSSSYWYTSKGVYRRSNHWGMEVASCSWLIQGRNYSPTGVSNGYTETAFISWDELYAKGSITRDGRIIGFTFEDPYGADRD